MKRTSSVILLLPVFLFTFIACTRIDTTELGDDLIPAVDNVNTFDTTLEVITDNFLFSDTTRTFSGDDMAVGYISNDPEFGQTVAEMYFNLGATSYPFWPYNGKDSVKAIDSVVLSLAYRGTYGDTVTPQTYRVFDIGTAAGFKDSIYRLTSAPFRPLGLELGSVTVAAHTLNDSINVAQGPDADTPRTVNVLRIRLDSSLGRRIVDLDSTGHKTDSAFRSHFRGLAVLTDTNNAGNGLVYFNLADFEKSKLIIYYKVQRNGKLDTTFSEYKHIATGQANLIRRKPQGNFAAYINNGNPADDKLYIQSTPGSYATVTIPGLSSMYNRVIHRAELIVTRLETPSDDKFAPPNLLFLDEETLDKDSAYTIQNDFILGSGANNTFVGNFDVFGGALRSDKTYRFNISRRVQGIITRKEPVLRFRISAPFEPENYFYPPGRFTDYAPSSLSKLPFSVLPAPAFGRVVLWGGNAPDQNRKMRLYIVYSKI